MLLRLGDAGSMASITCGGARLVKQHQIAVYGLFQGMASRTGHFLVASLEGERSLLVIEKGGLPFVAVVANGAVVGASAELCGVGVLVAFATSGGGNRELHVQHGQFHVRRLVAIGTGDSAM